jgi:sugar phosphate isomerase/epimerase
MMNIKYCWRILLTTVMSLTYLIQGLMVSVLAQTGEGSMQTSNLLTQNNLLAWEIAHKDMALRNSEARAQMIKRMGFRQYAYISSGHPMYPKWDRNHSQLDIEAEIEAMKKHGIHILAWYYWLNTYNPEEDAQLLKTLEAFKRNQMQPQLWIADAADHIPKTIDEWKSVLPEGTVVPTTRQELEDLPESTIAVYQKIIRRADSVVESPSLEKKHQQVRREADRIRTLVKLAGPYGCKVNIYNHRGWLGNVENQLAVIERLEEIGVTDVGMVYNFSHALDPYHDDSEIFPTLWNKIKSRVVAVNITGLSKEGKLLYPSQGDHELNMMRTIQESGWKGPVGIFIPGIGDIEVMLEDSLKGVAWMAAELDQPGSGGERPLLNTSGRFK